MTKETQTAFSSDGWIEQTNGARCYIPCVFERLSTCLNLPQIQIGKISIGHVHLTSHLKHRRFMLTNRLQRQITNRSDIVGNIIPHLSVSARHRKHHTSVLITHGRSNAIDFELHHPLNSFAIKQLFRPIKVGFQVFTTVGVVDRKHWDAMWHLNQMLNRSIANALCWRI